MSQPENHENKALLYQEKNPLKRSSHSDEDLTDELVFQNKKSVIFSSFLVVFIYLILGMIFYHYTQNWTWIESWYFVCVTFSTIGFGDLAPVGIGSRIFTVFYLLFGVGMASYALSIIGRFILDRQEKLLLQMFEANRRASPILSKAEAFLSTGKVQAPIIPQAPSQEEERAHQKKKVLHLVFGVVVAVSVVSVWTGVFMLLEGWSFHEALYFTVVSSTTVGYGDLHPQSDSGLVLGSFLALSGPFLLAFGFGLLMDVYLHRQQRKLAHKFLRRRLSRRRLREMDSNGDGVVTLQEFMEFILLHTGRVEQRELNEIKRQFDQLDLDRTGLLSAVDCELWKKKYPELYNSESDQ